MSGPGPAAPEPGSARHIWEETERSLRAAYLRKVDRARAELLSDTYYSPGAFKRAQDAAFQHYNYAGRAAWDAYQDALETALTADERGQLPLDQLETLTPSGWISGSSPMPGTPAPDPDTYPYPPRPDWPSPGAIAFSQDLAAQRAEAAAEQPRLFPVPGDPKEDD